MRCSTSNNKNGFSKSQPHPQKISLVLSYCCLGIEMLQAHKKITKDFIISDCKCNKKIIIISLFNQGYNNYTSLNIFFLTTTVAFGSLLYTEGDHLSWLCRQVYRKIYSTTIPNLLYTINQLN